MSDLLGIGASGVRAYQSALTTVSENIANAGTAGYTRRTTDLREIAATGGSTTQRVISEGNGVIVAGVTRAADAFRAADVRTASADLARSETGIAWLERLEAVLSGGKLDDRLTSFFNSARAVAADPAATTPRVAMLEAADAAAGAFRTTGAGLDRLATELDATAQDAVAALESLGAALAKVNDGLGRSVGGTSAQAQLLDQRDRVIEEMSALSDVAASFDASGRATVRLGNGTGPVFVAGNEAGQLRYARNDEGAVAFSVLRAATTSSVSPGGGALAGIADTAQRLSDARDRLDAIATGFAEGVNAVQAQGRTLDGVPGAAMFATGTTPSDLSIALTDPRGVAAAGVGGGPRDNGNLLALDTLRSAGKFEAESIALVAANAATLDGRRAVADAQSAIRDGAIAARDAVSGVNLDQEAVDLLRFQQAYQASSRVIQVARETLQSILDIR